MGFLDPILDGGGKTTSIYFSLVSHMVLLSNLSHITGLDRKDMQLDSHAPTHTLLKIRMWYAACIKYCMVFPHLLPTRFLCKLNSL